MELASAFQIQLAGEDDRSGAFASFPYDRDLVRRFREAFPQARWRNEKQSWFVPGTTAVQRLEAWKGQELETLDRYADAKGRDAYLFEPLESAYLTVADDLKIRTPYSRTVVETLRSIPWAHWNPEEKLWHVPFRSYENLRQKWPVIEEAAQRNEPEARRKRREAQKCTGAKMSTLFQAERRRWRYPVPGDDLPPLETPLSTFSWGVVVFEGIESHVSHEALDRSIYPHVTAELGRYVWAFWRMPTLMDIYRAKPIRELEAHALRTSRGWWRSTREELQERARKLRELERAQRSRHSGQKSPAGP